MRRLAIIGLFAMLIGAGGASAQPPSKTNYLCHAEVTLTDAQIKALPTTAITVISAPSAGKWAIPAIAVVTANAVAGPYTNIDPVATLALEWSGTWATIPVQGEFGLRSLLGDDGEIAMSVLPAVFVMNGGPSPIAAYYDASQVIGAALTLAGWNNGAGNWTGGHVANTLTVSVLYSVLNTTTGAFGACP